MQELVFIKNQNKEQIPVTNSRYVAETFEKRHDHILRDIENLVLNLRKGELNFGETNFKKSTYKDSQNKKQPEYLMTRDGFTLLAMGFTGQKALKFKLDYINAFNQMEKVIINLQDTKLEFPEFTESIQQLHEEPKGYHYSNEINMINKIVLGVTAKEFRQLKNLDKSKSIRPYLTNQEIKMIEKLQRLDIGLMSVGVDYENRKQRLQQYFDKISQIKLLGEVV